MENIKLGIYRHSKSGKLYKVIALAKHSETLEDLVIYEAQYDNTVSKIWARPLKMFNGEVNINGVMVPRFIQVN